MKKSLLYLFTFIFYLPIFGQDVPSVLKFDDRVYDNSIKTVMAYPNTGDLKNPGRTLTPAVVELGANGFIVEFDDLTADYRQYHIKVLSCTSDWQLSNLSEIEYLPEYNDFICNDYQVSQGTKVPYFHYRLELPPFKLAGNFLIYAYRERDKNNIVFSKRCIVYQNKINSFLKVVPTQDPALRRSHQQVDLEVNYNNYQIIDPRDIKILVRQNYRWNRTIRLKPSSVDEMQQKLNFQYFDNENVFPAGNEFRYFDNRNSYSRGMFVQNIMRGKIDEVYLSPCSNRSELSYIDMTDFNGAYIVDNNEAMDDNVAADYNWVTFGLKSHELEGEKAVYINASFNDWHLDTNNKMQYNIEFGGYVGKVLLKQGIFNYNYTMQDLLSNKVDENYFEGDFSDTNNVYEIIIYHKPFGSRAEQIISYTSFDYNKH